MKHELPERNTQRGAVLAVGLILLVVATLVTLTAMNTGVLQERMTANQDNNARSFMAAEAGGSDLVVEWLDESSWPTTGDAPNLPGTVGGDPSITYTVELLGAGAAWTDSTLNVLVVGRAWDADTTTVLARTELLIQLDRGDPPPPGGRPPVNPPAAISCFEGPCTINAGAGRGADPKWGDVRYGTVSGFNHPIPPLNCTGAGCRMQPQDGDRTMPAVPAVFLTNPDDSSVGLQGGNHNAYQGIGPDGSHVIGRDKSVAVTSEDKAVYPDDAEGNSTAPTWESVFGVNEDDEVNWPETNLTSTGSGGNITYEGDLVIDGETFVMTGTSLFVGLVVIRNCGQLDMRGNPDLYGAVIIDAVRRNADGTTSACPSPYDPFAGSGTPAVRFSRAPLSGPPDEGTGTGTGGSTGVKIWAERLL